MWLDPFTLLGALSLPFFVSNFLTAIGFLFATYFTVRYVINFFEGMPKPMSWIMIVAGLTSFCISEFGQFLLPYRTNPAAIEAIMVLIAQNFGIILIVLGTILMFREVTT